MNFSKETNYAIDLIICSTLLKIMVHVSWELTKFMPDKLALAVGLIVYFVITWKYVGWRKY